MSRDAFVIRMDSGEILKLTHTDDGDLVVAVTVDGNRSAINLGDCAEQLPTLQTWLADQDTEGATP